MSPELSAALVGGASGIICAFGTAWVTAKANKAQTERADARQSAYLASQLGPALREFASACIAVTYDDGNEEGRPSGSNGTCQPTVQSPRFSPDIFTVEWKALPADLMTDVLTFPEHAADKLSILADPGYDDPPDYGDYFSQRMLVHAELGLTALDLVDALHAHAKLRSNPRTSELRGTLQTRLEELAESVRAWEKRRAAVLPPPPPPLQPPAS